MAWLKVEDTTHSHPMVLALALGGDDRQLNEALGWLARCSSYSAEHLLDGFIPESTARQFAGDPHYPRLLKAARAAKFLTRRATRSTTGLPGVSLIAGDDVVFHLRTREEIEIDRARRGSTRVQDERMKVRHRDGDQCRYCRKTVDFGQRKTARGGTYDHPEPTDRATFVVACRGCNQAKGKRTPHEWHAAGGHLLQDPPADPHYNQTTVEQLTAAGFSLRPGSSPLPDPAPQRAATASAAPARTSTQLDDAASGEASTSEQPAAAGPVRSSSDPDPSTDALPRQAPPGRDGSGSGRAGSGAPAPPQRQSRDGPTRGRRGARGRGRRGRQPRPPPQEGRAGD